MRGHRATSRRGWQSPRLIGLGLCLAGLAGPARADILASDSFTAPGTPFSLVGLDGTPAALTGGFLDLASGASDNMAVFAPQAVWSTGGATATLVFQLSQPGGAGADDVVFALINSIEYPPANPPPVELATIGTLQQSIAVAFDAAAGEVVIAVNAPPAPPQPPTDQAQTILSQIGALQAGITKILVTAQRANDAIQTLCANSAQTTAKAAAAAAASAQQALATAVQAGDSAGVATQLANLQMALSQVQVAATDAYQCTGGNAALTGSGGVIEEPLPPLPSGPDDATITITPGTNGLDVSVAIDGEPAAFFDVAGIAPYPSYAVVGGDSGPGNMVGIFDLQAAVNVPEPSTIAILLSAFGAMLVGGALDSRRAR